MGYRRYNVSATNGTLSGLTSGNGVVYGNSLFIGESGQQVRNLTARVVATVAIAGVPAVAMKWQGSSDNTNWDDIANNPANAAGTAFISAAASVTKAFEMPSGGYGYKYARAALVLTSTTAGTTNDTYIIGYTYRQLDAGEASL